MAIITISRGSYSRGKLIAEKIAERLGYECVSRDVLIEASEQFNIPEVKLVRALHDAPSVLERFTHGKERYVAFFREAFLRHMRRDNVVYHGLAGHFFLEGVGHTLKVRILADMEDRVREEMAREGITGERARHLLKKDDEERRKWALALYGIDTSDPSLYDLVIRIRKIDVDAAVDLIAEAVRHPAFQTTAESRQDLEDIYLASRAKCGIVAKWPRAEVSAENGVVVVHVQAALLQEEAITREITRLLEGSPDFKEIRVSIRPTGPYGR